MFVVAAGSVAADAIPLRTAALGCSAATLACGLLLGLSGFVSAPTGADRGGRAGAPAGAGGAG